MPSKASLQKFKANIILCLLSCHLCSVSILCCAFYFLATHSKP